MTQDRKPRIALDPDALYAVKIWAALEDMDPGGLASRILLAHMPAKVKDLITPTPSEGIATKGPLDHQPSKGKSGAVTVADIPQLPKQKRMRPAPKE